VAQVLRFLLFQDQQQEGREETDRFLLFQEHQRLTQVEGAALLITLVVQVVQVVAAQVETMLQLLELREP
jgi:hypothetical protein